MRNLGCGASSLQVAAGLRPKALTKAEVGAQGANTGRGNGEWTREQGRRSGSAGRREYTVRPGPNSCPREDAQWPASAVSNWVLACLPVARPPAAADQVPGKHGGVPGRAVGCPLLHLFLEHKGAKGQAADASQMWARSREGGSQCCCGCSDLERRDPLWAQAIVGAGAAIVGAGTRCCLWAQELGAVWGSTRSPVLMRVYALNPQKLSADAGIALIPQEPGAAQVERGRDPVHHRGGLRG